jgi:DeoR family deoxyribose operon repressor
MTAPADQRAGAILRRPQRLRQIARALNDRGPIRLRDAAALLGVSEMTVRRDLAASGEALTYLGGYLLPKTGGAPAARYVLGEEEQSNTAAKIAACERAAQLIDDGDTVFIDCGSTLPHLASRIPRGLHATVVCYSLNVAQIVCGNPDLRVILLGGLWHAASASFSSDENLALVGKLGINKAFISAAGVDPKHGASCVQFHEVGVKQAAMARSVRKYLVVDASKFGQVRPAAFAVLEQFDAIVCDRLPTPTSSGLPGWNRLARRLLPAK